MIEERVVEIEEYRRYHEPLGGAGAGVKPARLARLVPAPVPAPDIDWSERRFDGQRGESLTPRDPGTSHYSERAVLQSPAPRVIHCAEARGRDCRY
jgi:hypothetical protein